MSENSAAKPQKENEPKAPENLSEKDLGQVAGGAVDPLALDGTRGESTDRGHKGEIDIES